MHMLRYMQALVKVAVKNPLLWVLILVCQLLLVAPFIKGDATMGYFLGKEELDVALRESRKNMEEGVYDSAPSEVRERAQERISLMTRACLTDDPAEYARLRAQLLEGDIADFKAGTLSVLLRRASNRNTASSSSYLSKTMRGSTRRIEKLPRCSTSRPLTAPCRC